MQLNRRNFLKAGIAMGAGAMLTATGCAPQAPAKDGEGVQNETTQKMADTSDITAKWSFETAPDPIPSDAIAKVESTAIVVVGAGPSGFAAALSALDAGESNVVVLAKSPTYNALGGSMHAFNTKTMKSYGYELSDNEISHRLRTEWLHQGNMCDHNKWARAAYASGEAMDWLCAFVEAEGNRTVLEIGPHDKHQSDGVTQVAPARPDDSTCAHMGPGHDKGNAARQARYRGLWYRSACGKDEMSFRHIAHEEILVYAKCCIQGQADDTAFFSDVLLG